MPLDFTAIDFETANHSAASACAVGLTKVRDGRVVASESWLIRPPLGHDAFHPGNMHIHGIRPEQVVDAPSWAEQLDRLLGIVDGDPLVAHNAGFDMGVIRGISAASELPVPALDYFCSLQIARRTYSLDSYRLPVAAFAAGFEDFAHHDAGADAQACAAIVVHAAKRHGATELDELLTACKLQRRSLAPVVVPEPAAPYRVGDDASETDAPVWAVPGISPVPR